MDIVAALPTLDLATNAGYSPILQQQTLAARDACVPLVTTLKDWRDKVGGVVEAYEQQLTKMQKENPSHEASKAFI